MKKITIISSVVAVIACVTLFASNSEAWWWNSKPKTVTSAGKLLIGRSGHTATLLDNGRVLILGGNSQSNHPEKTAELYDPTTKNSILINDMKYYRQNHQAIKLNNGEVLILGGIGYRSHKDPWEDPVMSNITFLEIYNPTQNTFKRIARLPLIVKGQIQGIKLPSGKVLIKGRADRHENKLYLYNPSDHSLKFVRNLLSKDCGMHNKLINNGKEILFVCKTRFQRYNNGKLEELNIPSDTYSQDSEGWAEILQVNNLNQSKLTQAFNEMAGYFFILDNGAILMADRKNGRLFSPDYSEFTSVKTHNFYRSGRYLAWPQLIETNKHTVLIIGGITKEMGTWNTHKSNPIEQFDPETNTIETIGFMKHYRIDEFRLTKLLNGSILITGGIEAQRKSPVRLKDVEIYDGKQNN